MATAMPINLEASVLTEEWWESRVRSFQSKPPVDVVGLAESFGLKVWERELPDGVAGQIIHDPRHGGTAQYSIIVSKELPLQMKRFTVAHELAHFFLHKTLIGDGLEDNGLYHSRLSTLQEVQANKLAADILMPFKLIENEMRAGATSLDELAKRFNVTRQAIAVRLGVLS